LFIIIAAAFAVFEEMVAYYSVSFGVQMGLDVLGLIIFIPMVWRGTS